MSFTPLDAYRDTTAEVRELVAKLEEAAQIKGKGKSSKLVSRLFDSDTEVTRWKFKEWDYGKPNIVLPINARGLFISNDKDPSIVVRGYDKFFNINELPSTRWDSILKDTKGPYELSLKENGCIIFLSGLANGELVVCSKHSTGVRDDDTRNHALQGKLEVDAQLARLGKTSEELAKMLYELNVTAVAELCDDAFEEHVLEYSKTDAGLYLHGLNFNTAEFRTYPFEKISQFAELWGFRKVDYLVEEDATKLKTFLEKCAETGTYQDKEIEGFVIRCKDSQERDFFFKYKFEEPYLMYRQFREVTKAAIKGTDITEIKFNRHKYATAKYLEFVCPLLSEDPTIGEKFVQGYGIIELRNRFLEHVGEKGIDLANAEAAMPDLSELAVTEPHTEFKYILIPVATIGCGKTTTFLTLQNLYPQWGHVQNDNVTTKVKNQLVLDSLASLANADVEVPLIMCDRNNHQFRERAQLFKDFLVLKKKYFPSHVGFKFVCVNFVNEESVTSGPNDKIWDITTSRVLDRGDNHQSIHVSDGEAFVKSIMKGFVNRFQPVDVTNDPDMQFDLVINCKVDSKDSSLKNTKLIIDELKKFAPELIPTSPSDKEIQIAFDKALDYQPTVIKFVGKKGSSGQQTKKETSDKKEKKSTPKQKKKEVTYYGVSISNPPELQSMIEKLFVDKISQGVEANTKIWSALKEANRIQDEFHVTMAHINQKKNGSPKAKENWKKLVELVAEDLNSKRNALKEPSSKIDLDWYADIKLVSLVFDSKLLCIKVQIGQVYQLVSGEYVPVEGVESSNVHPHITIGTMNDDIKPYMSNNLLNNIYFDEETKTDGSYNNQYVYNWDEEVVLHKMRLYAFF